jgi:hypothetical protein
VAIALSLIIAVLILMALVQSYERELPVVLVGALNPPQLKDQSAPAWTV